MTISIDLSSIQNNSASAEKQSPQVVQDSPQPREIPNASANPTLTETLEWLIAHNYPPLPVAPAQDPHKYPKTNKKGEIEWSDEEGVPKPLYTGKNPSYLDKNGIPHLVNHHKYQNEHPTQKDLDLWFANNLNGIGTLGWWNNTIWLDFDTKQFESQDKCDEAVFNCIAQIRQLTKQQPFIEETHSGGWRIGVTVRQKPTFTNFALTPGGTHIGEALGEGRFTVLAPTIGPSGNPYRNVARECLPEIESLESIGIHPRSTKNQPKAQKNPQSVASTPSSYTPGSISLEQLGNKTSRDILNGNHSTGDRSEELTIILNEAYGWVNWGNEKGININGSPEDIACQYGASLNIDAPRIGRIIKSVDAGACQPAAFFIGGEESCWKKIYKLDRATFDAKCPAHIRDAIYLEFRQYHSTPVREATTGRVVTDQSAPKVVSGNFGGSGSGGNGGSSGKGFGGNGGNGGSGNDGIVYGLVKELLEKGLPEDKFHAELIELAAATEYSVNDLTKLAKSIEDTETKKVILPEEKKEFDILSKYHKKKFDLYKVFPRALAKALSSKAEADRLDPALVYANLVPGAASVIGAEVAVVVKEGETPKDHWREFPQLWVANVGEPSIGKSQAAQALLSPLKQKQLDVEEGYSNLKKELAQKKINWERIGHQKRDELKGTEEDPQVFEEKINPPPTKFIESGSPEACWKRLSENKPKEGVLFHFDELKRMMLLDQYKSGDGDTRQHFLDSWSSPFTITMHRVNDQNSYRILAQSISIVGGIQPAILRRLAIDSGDGDGLLSRFLFINAKIHEKFSIWSDMKVGIAEPITALYEKLGKLPAQLRKAANLPDLNEHNQPPTVDLMMSPEAKQLYIEMYEKLHRNMELIHGEEPAMFGYLGKMPRQIARLASIIHCIRVALGEEDNPLLISQTSMECAIYAAEYHIGQYRLILSKTDENGVPADLIKIQEFIEKRAGKEISAAEIQRGVYRNAPKGSKRTGLSEIREWMKLIADWGKAKLIGAGAKLKILVEKVSNSVIAKTYDQNYANPLKPESTTNSGFQELHESFYEKYEQSSAPDLSVDNPQQDVESSTEDSLLSRDIGEDPEDLASQDVRKVRKESEVEDSTLDVEPVSDDSELAQKLSQEKRNCDTQVETEAESDNESNTDPEDDPDPDNDPPASVIDPNELTEEDAPQKGKGQIMLAAIGAIAALNPFKKKVEVDDRPEEEQWNEEEALKDMARELMRCDSIEELQVLRKAWRNREALNAAAKLLTLEKHSQIKDWVIQLNKTHPLFQIGDTCTYSGKEFGLEKLCESDFFRGR